MALTTGCAFPVRFGCGTGGEATTLALRPSTPRAAQQNRHLIHTGYSATTDHALSRLWQCRGAVFLYKCDGPLLGCSASISNPLSSCSIPLSS